MKILGLQKLTLLDFKGTVACTVFTGGCNFRCPFCHNAGLVSLEGEEFSIEEVISFLKKRQGVLEGVVVTGGEPLLHHDIGDFLEKVKELGFKVKLDTNGTNPTLLGELIGNKLVDRVAMDIKSSPDGYSKAVGRAVCLDGINESIELLLSNSVEYEFRTTAVKGIHEKEDFEKIGLWIKGAREYYIQQFKDSGNLINPDNLSSFTEDELKAFADIVRRYVPSVQLRGID